MGGRPVNVFTRQKAGGDFLPTVIAANPGGTAGTGPAQAAFAWAGFFGVPFLDWSASCCYQIPA